MPPAVQVDVYLIADYRGLCLNPRNNASIAGIVLHRLTGIGIDRLNSPRNPQAVRVSAFDDSALVISMSRQERYPMVRRLFLAYTEQTAYWDVEDTAEMPAEAALRRIESLVDRLVDQLSAPEISRRMRQGGSGSSTETGYNRS